MTSVNMTMPKFPNVTYPSVGQNVLEFIEERHRPTRTKFIIEELSTECSEKTIFDTINALKEQGLILAVTNRPRFKDYIITDLGRQYVDRSPRTIKEIAEKLTQVKLNSLPKSEQTSETKIEILRRYSEELERIINFDF